MPPGPVTRRLAGVSARGTVWVDLDGALLHASFFLCEEYSVSPCQTKVARGSTMTPAWGRAPRKERVMRNNQRVADMADEVLARQARNRARRTGEPFEQALEAVLETEAGHQLQELRDGPHGAERAQAWQDGLAEERQRRRGRRG
jgi:hypothetical protein